MAGVDPWDVSLDPADQDGPAGGPVAAPAVAGPPVRGSGLRRSALVAVLLFVVVTWGPALWRDSPDGVAVKVLGRHLSSPVSIPLPDGAMTTADTGYVSFRLPDGAAVMASMPTEIWSGGVRTPLPSDPAGWLAQNPDVFVSRVRTVTVGGVQATQVDYRRSGTAQPEGRSSRLQLFCGWTGTSPAAGVAAAVAEPRPCTAITPEARVRATFVPMDGQYLLLEMVWHPEGGRTYRMPDELRRSYSQLLAGIQLG